MKKRFLLLPALLALCLMVSSALAQTEGDFSYSITNGEAKITAYTGGAHNLVLPDTLGGCPVTAIGVCAFRGCTTLEKVVIPDGVTRICSNAFQFCTSLAQLVIPESVTRIDTHAFYACASLKQLSLHDSISSIHSLAFYGCSALRLCNPDSLTAYVLTDFGYSFTHPEYPWLSLKAFEDAAGHRTFTIADCEKNAASVSFPDRITAIESYAFFGCDRITELVIPDGVTEIAQSAFSGCTALTQIKLPGSIAKIADDAFANCPDVTIIAPAGSAAAAFALINGLPFQAL